MKVVDSAIGLLAALPFAFAQHHHGHQHLHEQKRDVVTSTEYSTMYAPVTVWVNQFGSTVSVASTGCAVPTSSLAPVASSSTSSSSSSSPASYVRPTSSVVPPLIVPLTTSASSVFVIPESSSSVVLVPSSSYIPEPEPTTTSTPAVVAPTSSAVVSEAPEPTTSSVPPTTAVPTTSSVPTTTAVPTTSSVPATTVEPTTSSSISTSSVVTSASSTASVGPTGGTGVCYSPYTSSGDCKEEQQFLSDWAIFSPFSVVRLYGTDCSQLDYGIAAAKEHNLKLFAGIYDLTDVEGNLDTLITAAKGNWEYFDTISIGNELVNKGWASAADVVTAIGTVRTAVRAAGFEGPVVTVDTFNAMIANPELCTASDYCAANCHAYFDATVDAAGAGAYVKEQAGLVSAAAGGKTTVITESGWPYQGEANGLAIASKANQEVAIAGLKEQFSDGNIFLFSAYSDAWKPDDSTTFGTEKYWGFLA